MFCSPFFTDILLDIIYIKLVFPTQTLLFSSISHRFFNILISTVKLPLMIDSTQPDSVEAVLKIYPGRCIINSINLEDGGANLHTVCTLAKKYGAAVVALTINKGGMAMTTASERLETSRT